MTRRDKCFLVGKRAKLMTRSDSATAWRLLAFELDRLGEMDLPKFKHLIKAIRAATIQAKKKGVPAE